MLSSLVAIELTQEQVDGLLVLLVLIGLLCLTILLGLHVGLIGLLGLLGFHVGLIGLLGLLSRM